MSPDAFRLFMQVSFTLNIWRIIILSKKQCWCYALPSSTIFLFISFIHLILLMNWNNFVWLTVVLKRLKYEIKCLSSSMTKWPACIVLCSISSSFLCRNYMYMRMKPALKTVRACMLIWSELKQCTITIARNIKKLCNSHIVAVAFICIYLN